MFEGERKKLIDEAAIGYICESVNYITLFIYVTVADSCKFSLAIQL